MASSISKWIAFDLISTLLIFESSTYTLISLLSVVILVSPSTSINPPKDLHCLLLSPKSCNPSNILLVSLKKIEPVGADVLGRSVIKPVGIFNIGPSTSNLPCISVLPMTYKLLDKVV